MKSIQEKIADLRRRKHALELEEAQLANNPYNLPIDQYDDSNNPLVKFRNEWLMASTKQAMLQSGKDGSGVDMMLGFTVGQIKDAFCAFWNQGTDITREYAEEFKKNYKREFIFLKRITALLNDEVKEAEIISILKREFPLEVAV